MELSTKIPCIIIEVMQNYSMLHRYGVMYAILKIILIFIVLHQNFVKHIIWSTTGVIQAIIRELLEPNRNKNETVKSKPKIVTVCAHIPL